jgi:osmoprotectant transport system permease protein
MACLPGPLAAQTERPAERTAPVVVASKPFAESHLLGELFSQLLEARGFEVDRRPGLGSTAIVTEALAAGDVDVIPEYTGTGLLAVLGDSVAGRTPMEVFAAVDRAYRERYGARWLPPLGFENTYAMAMPGPLARARGLRALSQLEPEAPSLTAGFTPDFIGRQDGLPALERVYGLRFGEVRSLVQAVKYSALEAGAVDLIDGYSTDGRLDGMDVEILEDDRGIFPPYHAAPVVRDRVAQERPGVVAALAELANRLDVGTMRRMNRQVEEEGLAVEAVARDFLLAAGLVASDTGGNSVQTADGAANQGFLSYLWSQRGERASQTGRHLVLVAVSLLLGILVALPLAVAILDSPSADLVIRGVGVLQTIPSIALLAFMIPLLGIGIVPAVVALFLYSLLPIVRNTYQGLRDADPAAVASGEALGMTRGQVLRWIRLPLATPAIMAGIRIAAVVNVGTATLAAFIGAGGLGDPIVAGLTLADSQMILSGALPAALLAVAVDAVLGVVERKVRPRGLSPETPPTPRSA